MAKLTTEEMKVAGDSEIKSTTPFDNRKSRSSKMVEAAEIEPEGP